MYPLPKVQSKMVKYVCPHFCLKWSPSEVFPSRKYCPTVPQQVFQSLFKLWTKVWKIRSKFQILRFKVPNLILTFQFKAWNGRFELWVKKRNGIFETLKFRSKFQSYYYWSFLQIFDFFAKLRLKLWLFSVKTLNGTFKFWSKIWTNFERSILDFFKK